MTASSPDPRPARKGSLKPAQITGYLAGAVGTAAIFGAPQAEAAVTAVSFGFGSVLNTSSGYQDFSVNGGAFGTMSARGTINAIALGRDGAGIGSVYHRSDGTGGQSTWQGLPIFFNIGDEIKGTAATLAGDNGGLGRSRWFSTYSPYNLTPSQSGYIGFRTSTNNYGWANVSWDETAKALTINSAYVESVANTVINVGNVGAVPEPSRALLALAGLGGVALRRRRKQAA